MNKNLKFLAACFFCCSALSANNYEVCESSPPVCCGMTYEIEAGALFFKPSGSNTHYVAEAEPLPLPSPNWIINDVKPDYSVGFDVGVNTYSQDRGLRGRLNYAHFCSNDSNSKTDSS